MTFCQSFKSNTILCFKRSIIIARDCSKIAMNDVFLETNAYEKVQIQVGVSYFQGSGEVPAHNIFVLKLSENKRFRYEFLKNVVGVLKPPGMRNSYRTWISSGRHCLRRRSQSFSLELCCTLDTSAHLVRPTLRNRTQAPSLISTKFMHSIMYINFNYKLLSQQGTTIH